MNQSYIETNILKTINIQPFQSDNNNNVITDKIFINDKIIQNQQNNVLSYNNNQILPKTTKSIINESDTTNIIINNLKNKLLIPNTTMTVFKSLLQDDFNNIWVLLTNNNNTIAEILIYNSDLVYINKLIFNNDFIPLYMCYFNGFIFLSSLNEIKRYNMNFEFDNLNYISNNNILNIIYNGFNLYIKYENSNIKINENFDILEEYNLPILEKTYDYNFDLTNGLSIKSTNLALDYNYIIKDNNFIPNKIKEDKIGRIIIGGKNDTTGNKNLIIFDKFFNEIKSFNNNDTFIINNNTVNMLTNINDIYIDHNNYCWVVGYINNADNSLCLLFDENFNLIYVNDQLYTFYGIMEDHLNYIWIYGASDPNDSNTYNCMIYNNNKQNNIYFESIKTFSGDINNNPLFCNYIKNIKEIYYNYNYYYICDLIQIDIDNSPKLCCILDSSYNQVNYFNNEYFYNILTNIFVDSNNRIWFCGASNLNNYYICMVINNILDINNSILYHWDYGTSNFVHVIVGINEDKYGNIYLYDSSSSSGIILSIVDGKNYNTIKNISYNESIDSIVFFSHINDVYNDSLNRMWLVGDNSNDNVNIMVYNNCPYIFKYWNFQDRNFVYNYINTIYEDHLGRIWIGGFSNTTGNKSCVVLDSNFNIIKSWNYHDSNSDFVYNYIYSIYEDHLGRIWIGGDGDSGYKNCVVLDSNFNIIKSWNYSDRTSNFVYGQIKSIYEDHLGRIWIGGTSSTGYKNCVVLDSNFNLIKFWNYNNSDFVNYHINTIYEDHLSRIWVGGSGTTGNKSCVVLDSNFNLIKSWNYNNSDFVYTYVSSIYEDYLGRIWIGGNGSTGYKNCVVLDSNFNIIKSWNYHDSNSDFVYSEIDSIYEDHLGRIWIGGYGDSGYKSCVVLDSNFNLIKYWNYQDSDFVYYYINTIYEDHLGRIWIGGDGNTGYKICVVLDSNLNIINTYNYNNINISSINKLSNKLLGDIYDNNIIKYYSLYPKLLNNIISSPTILSTDLNNSSIINNNTNYINNSLNYTYDNNNIKSSIVKSDIIIYNESTINNKFKLSNISNDIINNNIYYNVSCYVNFNDFLIIGYNDKQPNILIYDKNLNIIGSIYNSNDNVNSMCLYKDYLLVGFNNELRIYNKNLNCICYKRLKNIKYINNLNNNIYIIQNNQINIYNIINNKLILIKENIIKNKNTYYLLKLLVNNNNIYCLSINNYNNEYLLFNVYNNDKLYFNNLLSINTFNNKLYLLVGDNIISNSDKDYYKGITLYTLNNKLIKNELYNNSTIEILYNIILYSIMLLNDNTLKIIFNDNQQTFYIINFNITSIILNNTVDIYINNGILYIKNNLTNETKILYL